jgi:hypothetical protein
MCVRRHITEAFPCMCGRTSLRRPDVCAAAITEAFQYVWWHSLRRFNVCAAAGAAAGCVVKVFFSFPPRIPFATVLANVVGDIPRRLRNAIFVSKESPADGRSKLCCVDDDDDDDDHDHDHDDDVVTHHQVTVRDSGGQVLAELLQTKAALASAQKHLIDDDFILEVMKML